jgi:hypothetical protein
VVYETIDGETILIHLGTGTYYSLDGVGSELWVVLAGGSSVASVLAAATDRYLGDPGVIEAGVSGLVQELVREGLMIEEELPTAGASSGFPPGRIGFSPPVLHAYDDMQEFMLVDPLHDVDEVTGWPHVKAE